MKICGIRGKNSFEILRAYPEHADQLTQIAIAAKRHWNYPEKWMQLWIPTLTISPEYILKNETWMAVLDDRPVAYYSLKLDSVIARRVLSPTKQSPLMIKGLLRRAWSRYVLRTTRPPGPSRTSSPKGNDGEALWLDNLWVLPEHMGQGIGRSLFEHALDRSRSRGAAILKIEADPNAESFYEKMGARKVREQHGEVDGQPRILPVMEISL